MRIAIISKSSEMPSARLLLAAGARRGHEMIMIPTEHGGIALSDDSVEIVVERIPVGPLDAVIPRVATHHPGHGISLIRQFELSGVYVLNGSYAVETCRHKFRTLAQLSADGIPVPQTVLLKNPGSVLEALAQIGDPPLVVKQAWGAQGRGVSRCDTLEAARSLTEALLLLDEDVLVQEYIAEAAGRDVKVLVCEGEVLAAVRREAQPGHFRATVREGARVIGFRPGAELARIAVGAIRSVGLELGGVDLLESDRGPLVIEVNASPGLQHFEEATGLDLAGRVLQYVERRCEDRER